MSKSIINEHNDHSESHLAAKWDEIMSEQKELYPQFYEFMADAAQIVGLSPDAAIVDIGCGTGRLLICLVERGYHNLTGLDISQKAVEITQSRVPGACIFVHNIVQGPLAERFDAIFMTEVIEHVVDPHQTLSNVYQSLKPGGYLFLSFPNRLAYGPLLYLRWLRHLVGWWPWIRHWIMYFTMPYEMRSTQPIDHAYDSSDVAGFIQSAGFKILRQRGMRLLPMFRIPGLDFTEAIVARLERMTHQTPIQWWYYRSMFICNKQR